MANLIQKPESDRSRFCIAVGPFDLRVSQAIRELAAGVSRQQILNTHGAIVAREAMARLPLSVLVKM